jgi:hypothetical protein
MEPGYSRLLIHDAVMPAMHPPVYMTTLDMAVMSGGGGAERTEAVHRETIEAAGFRVVAVHHPGDGLSESIIEAEVA